MVPLGDPWLAYTCSEDLQEPRLPPPSRDPDTQLAVQIALHAQDPNAQFRVQISSHAQDPRKHSRGMNSCGVSTLQLFHQRRMLFPQT